MILKKLLLGVVLLTGYSGLNAQKNVNFSTELRRLADISQMPAYLNGTLVKQISSYDRTGGNDDGFSGKYSYLRKNDDGTLVIFEAEGQGVIERIWTPTPTNDTLDFYFDGSKKPGLSIRFRDLFTGDVAPFLKPLVNYHLVGGYYSYVPIPYSKGCKIVLRGQHLMFHQIQYREYDNNYKVKTYDPNFTSTEKKLLEEALTLWDDPSNSINNFYAAAPQNAAKNFIIKPGQTEELAEIKQGGRIVGIELGHARVFEGMHRDVDLRITWENQSQPAVLVPVADFFGYAFGQRSMQSLLVGADAVKAYSYIPMPFDSGAKVELVYRKNPDHPQPDLNIRSKVFYTNKKRDSSIEGRFYAQYNNYAPDMGVPWSFLKGDGKGHYVGTVLISQATEYKHFTEFFEGDDQTIVDGKLLVHGTGSEDYFNGGWYAQIGGWVERLGGPVSGCLDYNLPLSRTGGYRFFISDKMPFYKNIDHNMEHGPENNNRQVHYSSVGMYYASEPVQASTLPAATNTNVFIPDTVSYYTRLMRHLTYNGDFKHRDGNAVLHGNSNTTMNINTDEIPAGKYKIYLNANNAGTNQVEVKIFDAARSQDWQKVSFEKKKGNQLILLGTTEVMERGIPTNILFRAGVPNPEISFDRVTLIRE